MSAWSPIEDVVLVRCRLRGDSFADIAARAFPGRSAVDAELRFMALGIEVERVLESMATPVKRRTPAAPVAIAVQPDAEQARPASSDMPEARGCQALLRALISYGFRHDGLPGLEAAQFLALAKREGIKGGR